ncbi:MAG: PIN domain-containing protein [Gammaproteobacteria bacterium]
MSVDFIDSNIFVYLFDEKHAKKRQIAESIISDSIQTRRGCISFQVVQETLNVLTQKLAKPVTAADAALFLNQVLMPMWRIMPGKALYQQALETKSRYGYSFYDALIIAAALESGSKRLLSEDMQHEQRIGKLQIINPF